MWDDKKYFRFCFGFKQSVLGLQTARWVTAGSVLITGKTTAGIKEVTLAQNPRYHIHSCLSHHNFVNYRLLEMVGKMLIPADAKMSFGIEGQYQVVWAKSCLCCEYRKSLRLLWKQVLFQL